MKHLSQDEEKQAIKWMKEAAVLAASSSCKRKKCGSIIVSNDKIIGKGFNSPPGNLKSQCRCLLDKEMLNKNVTDKTCCVHAEQRAIMDALKNNPQKIKGSTLYFTRVDSEGKIEKSGKPYCTICSKMSLDAGVGEFVLWHEEGICAYNTEEYNKLSFDFK